MHRQGYDLQLAQFDELARERDGHLVRAHTTASCAEGGVGGWGVHETGSTPRKAALARWGIEIDR